MSNELLEGDIAPDFLLPTDADSIVKLSDINNYKIIYFYPKDDTPGCTKEALSFQTNIEQLKKRNITIIGISKDSVERHLKFKAKYSLDFTLGSDTEGEVCAKYGVWAEKSMFGKKYMGILRKTFLVSPEMKIIKIWDKVKVSSHAEDIIKYFDNYLQQ